MYSAIQTERDNLKEEVKKLNKENDVKEIHMRDLKKEINIDKCLSKKAFNGSPGQSTGKKRKLSEHN
jgi:hypothetical protein